MRVLSLFQQIFLKYRRWPHRWSSIFIGALIVLLLSSATHWLLDKMHWVWFSFMILPFLLHYWWKPRFWPPIFLYSAIAGVFFCALVWRGAGYKSFAATDLFQYFIAMSFFGFGYAMISGLLFRYIFWKEYFDYTHLYLRSTSGKKYGVILGILIVALGLAGTFLVDASYVPSGFTRVKMSPGMMRVTSVFMACLGLYVIYSAFRSNDPFDSERWTKYAITCRYGWMNTPFQQQLLEKCAYQIDIAQVVYLRYGESSIDRVASDEKELLPEGGIKKHPDIYRIHLWKTRGMGPPAPKVVDGRTVL